MAFADDYELINGIPVPKKYIKQPEIVPLPEDQPDWQAQHELPAAPVPVSASPAIEPVDNPPVPMKQAPTAAALKPTNQVIAPVVEGVPTVLDLPPAKSAKSAVEVTAGAPETPALQAKTTVATTPAVAAEPEPAPEAITPEQREQHLIEMAEEQGRAVAEGEIKAAAATEEYQARIKEEIAKRELERVKDLEALKKASDNVQAASKAYADKLAQEPKDRRTANLWTILFSTMATAMSRGKIPNNALQLIQAGAEQQERETMRSNAQAKAEVERARQLYGDTSSVLDVNEHVFQTRMLGHSRAHEEQIRSFAAGTKSEVAKIAALTIADRLALENEAKARKLAADEKEAIRKADADAAEQRRKDAQFQLDKVKTYADITDKKENRRLGWARLSFDERKLLKDDEKQALEEEYKKGEIARLQETVKQMKEGKTVKLVNGEKYSAPTAKIAEDLANIEVFSSHALTGLDELLNTRVEEGKQFWDSPAGKKMTTLYTDLLLQLKGPEYAQLGVIAGPDMELMEGLAGKNPADAWLSTKPQLEGLRKRIAQRRAAKHKILGQYEGEVKEIERRLPADEAKITPEQAESQFRTAVTAAGTVASAEDRKAGLDSYDAQMKAANRLPDAYRKIAVAKDEEEAAIKRLQEQAKALPSGGPQAAALQDQIAQRKEVAQALGLKERDYETRFREQGGTKRLNANQRLAREAITKRQTGRGLADDFLNTYMVKESEPVFEEIQKLKAEGRTVDAVRALYQAQKGKPGADQMLGILQKIEKLNKD